MSFALPAALLLFLALPGFIFVYAYKGRLRPQNDALVSNASMTLGWVIGIALSVFAHAVWVPLANLVLHLSGRDTQVDLDSIAYLLAGEYKEGFVQRAQAFTLHPYAVLIYLGSLYAAAGLTGMGLHRAVIRRHWDRKYPFLRFNNPWHYLFSDDSGVDAVLVAVTCQHQDHTSLYVGILESYDFTAEGQLERLILRFANRAQLLPDSAANPTLTPIPGDKFLIWCRDINTLNVDYLHTKVVAGPAPRTRVGLTRR